MFAPGITGAEPVYGGRISGSTVWESRGRTMKRAYTLKENYEFRRVYQRGASAVSGSMVVYCRKNKLNRGRLGITASTKIGGAVTRNRARRRLREVYRLNRDKLKTGWDIILVARGRTASAPWKELNDTFRRLCRKLDLLEDGR